MDFYKTPVKFYKGFFSTAETHTTGFAKVCDGIAISGAQEQ